MNRSDDSVVALHHIIKILLRLHNQTIIHEIAQNDVHAFPLLLILLEYIGIHL